jgi:mannose-6-phosphate isomerase-like protein (cupin superfamily)
MHSRRVEDAPPIQAPHGEIVRELAGMLAGGTHQHSLAHITLPPGKASRKHYHPIAEESYYLLSGVGRVVIDEETQFLTPGQMVVILPGQVHQIFNDNPAESISYLAICTPPWTPDCSVFIEDESQS